MARWFTKSLQAAQQIETRHPQVTVEVIDLRSLSPYDWPAIEGIRREDESRHRRARGLPVLGIRRGDRGAHRRRAVLRASMLRSARVGALGHLGGLQPEARGRDSAADRRSGQASRADAVVLIAWTFHLYRRTIGSAFPDSFVPRLIPARLEAFEDNVLTRGCRT